MRDFLLFISDILWDSVMIYLLLGAGIWFTYRTGFVQFRYFRQFRNSLKKSLIPHPEGITAFQALCTSLAARVGSGNLAGVALAIAAGGPGAVFWMWVTALFGMATSFAECTLAQIYKGRDAQGQFRGGPAWYMERGLGMRWMGVLFSVFLIIAFGFVFNAVQANAVSNALAHALNVPKLATGVAMALCIGLVIVRGINGVVKVAQWMVPFMALGWVVLSVGVMLWHIDSMPQVISMIFKSAFGWQEAAAGTLGYTFSQAISAGFQRGMFSNEAGMGSTPNAAAAASSWPPHPASQGIVQMAGVFIDTIVICSATAMIILLCHVAERPITMDDGIVVTQHALTHFFGSMGADLIALIAFLFSFTSIIANYAYAENNLVFLRLNGAGYKWLLRIMVMLMVMFGALAHLPLVWQMADVIMALMAITNLIAILLLSPIVRDVAQDYLRQRRLGVTPQFDPQRFPEIHHNIEPGVWNNHPKK